MTAWLHMLAGASLGVGAPLALLCALRGPLAARYRARTLYCVGMLLITLMIMPWRPAPLRFMRVSVPSLRVVWSEGAGIGRFLGWLGMEGVPAGGAGSAEGLDGALAADGLGGLKDSGGMPDDGSMAGAPDFAEAQSGGFADDAGGGTAGWPGGYQDSAYSGALRAVADAGAWLLGRGAIAAAMIKAMLSGIPLSAALAWIWAAGVLTSLSTRIYRHVRFARFVRRWGREPDAGCLAALETERARLRLGAVRTVSVPLGCAPMVVWLGKAVLILPEAAASSPHLLLMLRHELCHLRGWDLAGKALIELAMCIHWFNPLMPWVGRQLSLLCEMACDEMALEGEDELCRSRYLGALLGALAPGLDAPVSTRFDGGVRAMKHRMERLMSIRPRKAGALVAALLVAAAVFMGGVAAEAGLTGQAVEIPAVEIPARRVPDWVAGDHSEQMSDEDYAFLMGLARADMDDMTLSQWRAYLEPNAGRIKETLDRYLAENAFMLTLLIDAEGIINPDATETMSWWSIDYRYGVDDFDSGFIVKYAASWRADEPDKVSVGTRDAMLSDIRKRVGQVVYATTDTTDADDAGMRTAVDSEMRRLETQYADVGIALTLTVESVELSQNTYDEQNNDMTQVDYDYLMGFRVEGYQDMSVEAFSKTIDAEREAIRERFTGYAPHSFIQTLNRTLAELAGPPTYFCSAHMEDFIEHGTSIYFHRDLNYVMRWNTTDPSQVTIRQRDAAIVSAHLRVEAEGRDAIDEGGTDDEMSARFIENVQSIAQELTAEGIEITVSDMSVGPYTIRLSGD